MTLPFIRPIQKGDLDTLVTFAHDVGYGLTTLPREKSYLKDKIAHSIESFSTSCCEPKNEAYLFVLETPNKEVIGVTGIISRIGVSEPFYAYHVLHTHRVCKQLNIDRRVPLLHFTEARKKPTEIGTLFLKKEHRKGSFGSLLSFCRFLYMANFEKRFAPVVIAEMRGVSDSQGISPFYEAIGKHFLEVSFDAANHLRLTAPEAITTVFPEYPIYPDLLPTDANEVIGHPHPDTLPALKLLEKQGFKRSHYVDIFDAGPHVFSPLLNIKSVKESMVATVTNIVQSLPDSPKAILANTKPQFRATIDTLLASTPHEITLTKTAAKTLQVDLKENIRYLPTP